MTRRLAFWVAGVALAAALGPTHTAAQSCAMCRSAIQSAADPLVRGINLSVLFMVTMPFAVVGSIGGWLAYAYRRARRRAATPDPAAAGSPEPPQGIEDGREGRH